MDIQPSQGFVNKEQTPNEKLQVQMLTHNTKICTIKVAMKQNYCTENITNSEAQKPGSNQKICLSERNIIIIINNNNKLF